MKIVTRIRPSTTTNAPVVSIGSQLVTRAGVTLKSRSAKPIAITEHEDQRAAPDLGRDLLVPFLLRRVVRRDGEARKPIASDSPRAMMPRMIGSRKTRWRAMTELISWFSWAISPSGLRTASDRTEAAHHHALEDGLTPYRSAHALSLGVAAATSAARAEPALKRSTRPPVSSSFCLPV